MKDCKNVCKRLLFPPVWVMIILTIISAASLAAVFMKRLDTSPIAYVIYAVAFYSLAVLCIACSTVFSGCYRKIKKKICDNKYGNRYITDVTFRTHVSLYRSLTINLLYVAMNLYSGIWYESIWAITLAVYHIILAIMRFLLLRVVNRNGIGKEHIEELRRSRLCGMILLTLNLALSGVVVLIIRQNKGFEYAGILIYVMAMYTFYITTASIINVVKYRKYNSPVMSTAKIINLAAALVSMLSLETAMLSQFGGENTIPYFDQIMICATGACVCIIVVAMSFYTIVKANRELKRLRINNSEI